MNTPVDCTLDGNINGLPDSLELPALLSNHDDIWRCPDGFDSLPAWEGVSDFVLFSGSGSLVMTDGTTVGATGLTGYLGYTLTGCTSASCTITIDAIEGISRHLEGGYTEADGSGGTYEVAEMGFRARTAISGTWNKSRFNVTFPSAVLELQFWADPVSVDGLPVASGVRVIEVDQIVGSLRSTSGPLTLNLAYNLGFATLAVSLSTQ